MARRPVIRLLIWLSLVGGVALIWIATVAPVLSWRMDTNTQLAISQGKADRLLNSIANLEHEYVALSAEADFGDIWKTNSVSEATAKVQASLGTIARQNGVTFRSITPLQSPEMALVDAVAFRLEAELTLDRLVELLRALEYSSPLILVERSNIRRLARGITGATQPIVFVQLDITAPVAIQEDGA